MNKKQSLNKLICIMGNNPPGIQGMFHRNVFATACYFATINEMNTANKLLTGLFEQLGWERRKHYFNAIKESMPEYAKDYAREINPNMEIRKLVVN